MNEDLRNSLGKFCEAAAALAERLASEDNDAPIVESVPVPLDCMTRSQLAAYLQVSEQAIRNWETRTENPLPCGYAGDKPRYFLSDVQEWCKSEALRRNGKKSITSDDNPRKMPDALTTKPKGGSRGHIQALPGQAH